MPKVSILTTLHNRTRYLRPRVESILAQTLGDFEWIVIDDHSDDDTFERFWRLTKSDPRVLALRNATNLGHGPTMKKAYELARGDYVYVTDDDDTCAPTFLERMTTVLDAHPNVGLAYCRHLFMDAKGGTWSGLPRLRRSGVHSGETVFRELLRACFIRSPCSIVRREAAERAGAFRTFAPPCYVDYHLCLKTCLVADVAYIAEPLAQYRLHPERATRTKFLRPGFVESQEKDSFDLVENLFAHLPDDRRSLGRLKADALWYAADNLRPIFRVMREHGAVDTARALEMMVRRRVPHYPAAPLDPGASLKGRIALREAALHVVRRATYAPAASRSQSSFDSQEADGETIATPRGSCTYPVTPVSSISIVVCVRDQAEALDACLDRLIRLHAPGDCTVEIVVVDNASGDDAAGVIERHRRASPIPLRCVVEPTPGLSRARNRGIDASKGDVIAFTDADCLVAEDWMVRLRAEFEADPAVHVVGGRVELHDRHDYPLTIKEHNHYQVLTRASQLDGFLHGCNHAILRVLVEKIGTYDPGLGKGAAIPSGEDTDFVYRAFRAGLRVIYSPNCLVFHHHGRRRGDEIADLWRSYRMGTGAVRTKHVLSGDRAMVTIAARDYAGRLGSSIRLLWSDPDAAWEQLRQLGQFLLGGGLYLRHRYLATRKVAVEATPPPDIAPRSLRGAPK